MREWLESQEFYELCQDYRHAGDIQPVHQFLPTAAEAFETLKREILKHSEIVRA